MWRSGPGSGASVRASGLWAIPERPAWDGARSGICVRSYLLEGLIACGWVLAARFAAGASYAGDSGNVRSPPVPAQHGRRAVARRVVRDAWRPSTPVDSAAVERF
jgi:hypothetical protein